MLPLVRYRRTMQRPKTAVTIDAMLEEAQASLDRVYPSEFDTVIAEGALLVDIRDSALRDRQGPLEGALVIDLTVLEWRIAPSSDHRIVDVAPGQRVVLVCNEGYSSSLAAVRLQALGVDGATDLVGGFTALTEWRTAQRHR